MSVDCSLDEYLNMRALSAFYQVITNNTGDVSLEVPLALKTSTAILHGPWVIEFTAKVLPYSAYSLSSKAGGRPALSVAAIEYPGAISSAVISSFVPGQPEFTDRWFPAAFENQPFVLVAQNGARSGVPTMAGDIQLLAELPDGAPFGMVLFARRWRELISKLATPAEAAR